MKFRLIFSLILILPVCLFSCKQKNGNSPERERQVSLSENFEEDN